MDINFVQILASAVVSLIVGAVSAWVAGISGVSQGLKRAQREKAFDRRLDWYEKAFRTMARFRSSVMELMMGFHLLDSVRRAKLVDALKMSATDVDDCLNEAAIFAERGIVKDLVACSPRSPTPLCM